MLAGLGGSRASLGGSRGGCGGGDAAGDSGSSRAPLLLMLASKFCGMWVAGGSFGAGVSSSLKESARGRPVAAGGLKETSGVGSGGAGGGAAPLKPAAAGAAAEAPPVCSM